MLTNILGDDEHGKVLFLTNDFPPQHGGIQTFVRQLCGELPSANVVVYAPAHPDADAYDRKQPFTVIRDPSARLLPTPRAGRAVSRAMREHRCTVVVYGASVPLGILAPRLRAAGARHQIALTHGHEVWWAALPGTRHVLRHVTRHVDVVTYVSEYTRRRLEPRLGKAAQRLVRLSPRPGAEFHPGVDGTGVRRQWGIPDDALVVVCVARLVRRKGQDRLIRIWPRLLREYPDAWLLLVGDGRDRDRLHRMVRRRGLCDRVVFTGEVQETPAYYAAGDVFAMPVRNRWHGLEVEGFGISYAEAAATGLVVVPGRHGGAPEAIDKSASAQRAEADLLHSSVTRSRLATRGN